MDLTQFIAPLTGGLLIGLAASLMMITIGRIAGISGIAFNGVSSPKANIWAVMFMIGLVLGTGLFHFVSGNPVPAFDVPLPLIIAGGLAVGLGTKLGSGCTSGHGICGLGRFSGRSLVAVVVFMAVAMVTVFVRLHV